MWNLTAFLCVVWAASLLYGEMFAFWVPSLWACSWPHLSRSSTTPSSTMNGVEYPDDYVKVAVVTDPQLMDKTSLHLAPKSLALEIAQFYTDLFMRRAFMASVLPFKPDVILFLGDYFDGGPYLSDEEWQESLSRFKRDFDLNILESTNIQVHYLPGNHDIGYAALVSRMPKVIRRYEDEFGTRNYRFTIGKVDFIAVDAQTLDGHSQGNQTSATWNFIKNVSKDTSLTPRVLLTHIPLYRPDGTSCGPHRASPIISQRVTRAAHDQEILYQNYITEESTNNLLDLIRPVLILSGHDHDQCAVTHMSKYGPVREYTVGTISWQQGNLYPSFMLLSATNLAFPNASSSEDAISTHLCFLPVQLYIYIWYLSLFVLTLLALLLWPTSGVRFSHHFGDLMGLIRSLISCHIFRGGTKEKNEDENCEYEMVWDAEGSMHLIKKNLKPPTTSSSERGSVERGNAVMRSGAKKQISREVDASMPVDVNIHVGLDATAKLPGRTNKSKMNMVIRRLVRMLRMFTVIAAVNVPLYVLLLFKDWNDK
uniref:Calcineurin-like phosphoesterase domain-containing protein n=1 Tax=Davidia involucrata TaxID=16924 RepID=A0A5B7B5Z3_DAVIN